MAYQTVCSADDLTVGPHRAVKAGATSLIVYRLKDGYYATQSSCTHVFAPLAKGKIVDGTKIQCPFHRAKFDIKSGEVVEWACWPPGVVNVLNFVRGEKNLQTFPVRVKDGNVQVEV